MKKNALKLFATACVLTVGITLFACSPQQPATDADQPLAVQLRNRWTLQLRQDNINLTSSVCPVTVVLTNLLQRQLLVTVFPIPITPFTAATIPV